MYEERAATGAVVHLHSTHSVAVSCLAEIDPADVLPPITAYYVMRVGRLPLVPYFKPGDIALAEAVRGFAGKHHAVLLANHGPGRRRRQSRRRGQRDRGTRRNRKALSAVARRRDPLFDSAASKGFDGMKNSGALARGFRGFKTGNLIYPYTRGAEVGSPFVLAGMGRLPIAYFC